MDREKAHFDPQTDMGDTVDALFHKVDDKWVRLSYHLWPTDAGYPDWADRYHVPKELFVYRASK